MEALTTEAISGIIPSILFYLTVGTLGAFAKDIYELMTGKTTKIHVGEVMVGGMVSAFLCIGLSDTIFKDFSLNSMTLITFVLGGLGFEIFGNMTSIDKLRNLLTIIHEIRTSSYTASDNGEPEEPDGSDETIEEPEEPPDNSNDSSPVRIEEVDGSIRIIITTDNPVLVENRPVNTRRITEE